MAWIMPKRAKAASKKGGSMGSRHSGITDSGRISEELGVRYIRDMYDGRVKNVEIIPAPKKKRSKISKWVTGAKDAKSE